MHGVRDADRREQGRRRPEPHSDLETKRRHDGDGREQTQNNDGDRSQNGNHRAKRDGENHGDDQDRHAKQDEGLDEENAVVVGVDRYVAGVVELVGRVFRSSENLGDLCIRDLRIKILHIRRVFGERTLFGWSQDLLGRVRARAIHLKDERAEIRLFVDDAADEHRLP